jgi:hypothetical protein
MSEVLARIKSKNRTVVVLGLPQAAVPVMRLLAWHCPQLRVEVRDGKRHTLVALDNLDWTHQSMLAANVPQLARSGK